MRFARCPGKGGPVGRGPRRASQGILFPRSVDWPSLMGDILSTMGASRPEDKLTETPKPRRWTVIASGSLCGVLALVVIFTNRGAFLSPLAVVVVAAIGLAAVLLQVRFYNREQVTAVHPPLWLNVLGILFALTALFAGELRLGSQLGQIMALGAVGCFAISSAIVLHAVRKHRLSSK